MTLPACRRSCPACHGTGWHTTHDPHTPCYWIGCAHDARGRDSRVDQLPLPNHPRPGRCRMTTGLREALACLFTIALAAAVCILILAVTA